MAGKRVLIFTNHFYPENFKVNDAAFELAKNNFDVTVLTAIPDYPQGKFYKGYGLFSKRKEIINNVKVIRVPLIPRGKNNLFTLALNYASYAFFLTVRSFSLALFNRFDVILVHHTSPIFLGIPAVIVKKMQKIKMYLWNLDLWPESVSETTGFNISFVINCLNKIVKYIYRNSEMILISSRAFKQSVIDKGIAESKLIYFPNWAEDIFLDKIITRIDITKYGIDRDSFKIMFAGNIGEAQDMDNVMNAIEISSKEEVKINWIFIGEGRKSGWMKERVKELKLENTVFFLGQFPIEQMPSFFDQADAMLVTLKDRKIFSYTAPAKIQAYMASSKPILAMINGEGANIVSEAYCGFFCNAGDYKSLADNVLRFAKMAEQERFDLGKNGFNYYQANFSKEKAMDSLLSFLNN